MDKNGKILTTQHYAGNAIRSELTRAYNYMAIARQRRASLEGRWTTNRSATRRLGEELDLSRGTS